MTLQIIGAGLPRTGTTSLKAALEELLGDRTGWDSMRQPSGIPGWDALATAMGDKAGFGDEWDDPGAAKARYLALIDEVTAAIPEDRLLTWQPGDGWAPLCEALGVEARDEPFPHLNDTATFRAEAGMD